MTQPEPQVCVTLGAGAAHDVHDLGSWTQHPQLKPPLAKDLFNIHANDDEYPTVISRYDGAALLAQPLARRIAQGEIGLEEALRRFANHPNRLLKEAYKDVPPYLRDLETSYTNVPSVTPSSRVLEFLSSADRAFDRGSSSPDSLPEPELRYLC